MLLKCKTFSILFLCEDKDICRFSDLHQCSFKTDWKGALTQMFSYQYWEIFKNIYFKEHLWTAASRAPINGCSSKLKFGGQKHSYILVTLHHFLLYYVRQKLHFCQLFDGIWIFILKGLSQYPNPVMQVRIINHIDNSDKVDTPDMERVESKIQNLWQIYSILLTHFMLLVSFYTPWNVILVLLFSKAAARGVL